MSNRRIGRGSLGRKAEAFKIKKNAQSAELLRTAAEMRLGLDLQSLTGKKLVIDGVQDGSFEEQFAYLLDQTTIEKYRGIISTSLNARIALEVVFEDPCVEECEPLSFSQDQAYHQNSVDTEPAGYELSVLDGPELVPFDLLYGVSYEENSDASPFNPEVKTFLQKSTSYSIYYEKYIYDLCGTLVEKYTKPMQFFSVNGRCEMLSHADEMKITNFQALQAIPEEYIKVLGKTESAKRIVHLILIVLPDLLWNERRVLMRRLLFLRSIFLPDVIIERSLSDLALRAYLRTRITLLQELVFWSCSDHGIRPELSGWKTLEELIVTSLVHYETSHCSR